MRTRVRRRLLAAVLGAASLASGWAALRPESARATLPAARRPLWSPARLPALLAEAEGTVELERAVDSLLGPVKSSCVVVYEGDRVVLARRPDLALTPASTQKILVGAAALRLLGPDFRFETKVVAEERPRQGGVDRLWLVGSGDPFLATPEYAAHLADQPRSKQRQVTPLARLAEELANAGVHTVAGGIGGDDSRYDRSRIVPTWKPTYITDNEVGPLGALVVNSGFTRFTPPAIRAADPAVHAAGELARLARGRGIEIQGVPVNGVAPKDGVTLAEVRSSPLSVIVATMVRESDNTASELLVRELGRRGAGDGSTPAGTAVIGRELSAMGLPVEGLRLGDGSGLETTNAATCSLLAATLRNAEGARQWLAVTGRSGTLVKRLVDTPLEGKLAAKTGSIKGVTGLTGFLDGRRSLRFAFLANGEFTSTDGRVLQDRVAALLANYPGPQPRP